MNNNETIHDRIASLVDVFGKGKNTVFASLIGTNEGNIRGYIKGIVPKFDILEKIVRNTDVNADWLLTGRGTMLCEQKKPVCQSETQPASLTDESIIYMMYKEKDSEVKELMETIGSLKEKIKQLERVKDTSAWDAPTSTRADVG